MNSITGLVTEVSNNFYTVKTILGVFRNVPSCIGSCLVNDSVTLVFSNPSEHRNPVIINKLNAGVSFDSNKLLSKIMSGNGEWLTSESDFLNSSGLTLPSKILNIKLDGSAPGTIATIGTFDRFASGASLPGVWEDFVSSIDQHGLSIFTVPHGRGTSTIAAAYFTYWNDESSLSGAKGYIYEYVIKGESGEANNREIIFTGSEFRLGREFSRLAMQRRQGYLFVDKTSNAKAIYTIPLDSGIYSVRRQDNVYKRTAWSSDVHFPYKAGNISAYDKYVIRCGWSGWDKSDYALDKFNFSMQGTDPATLYLADPLTGDLSQLRLPDHSSRGILRIYERIPLEVDPDNYGLTYSFSDIDLKVDRVLGKTLRRLHSCGIWFNLSRQLLLSSGSPASPPGGGDIYLSQRIMSNIQSLRFPILSLTKKDPCVWISLTFQVDGSSSSLPGQCFWQLVSVNLKTKAQTLINQVATPLRPQIFSRFSSFVSTRESEILSDAASSRSVDGGDPDFYPPGYFYGSFSQVFPGGPGGFPYTVQFFLYLAGYFYDGQLDEPEEEWSEIDRFVSHPWPGDYDHRDFLVEDSGDTGLDAILPGSDSCPYKVFDLDGNCYDIVSEPIRYLDDILPDYLVTESPGALGDNLKSSIIKSTPFPTSDGNQSILYAHHRKSSKKYKKMLRTLLIKTSYNGAIKKSVDITERFAWNNSTADRGESYPLSACCWNWKVYGQFVLVLRQCYWSISSGKPDVDKREPYLEVFNKNSLESKFKISLHPPSDLPARLLNGLYDVAPVISCGIDGNGNVYAVIATEWIKDSDLGLSNKLELVYHSLTHITLKSSSYTRSDHTWQGKKETGIPTPQELSCLARNGDKAYWLESHNSLIEYTSP